MPAVDIPAPVSGWNATASLAEMKPTEAISMVNWIPRGTYVESRRGRSLHVSGLGGTVESLIAYRGTSANKLLACANGNIWDATGTPSSLKSGLGNNFWQSTHHTNRVIMTNGTDTPQVYNGAIADIVVTGVTATTLWGCNTFKGRAFYWQQNAQSFWYAAAGAYQGALVEFSLTSVVSKGGTLVQMLTITKDGGDGVDDLAVFYFSTGEVLLYQGDDPGSAVNWALVGKFAIGEPMNIRAHARVAGTEIVATKDGWVDLSAALTEGRYSEENSFSSKISVAAQAAALDYASSTGWACVLYPVGNMMLINIPISATESIQHVRDTASGGWAKFTNWNARSMCVHNDLLYFGDASGNVFLADTGLSDNLSEIPLSAICAFNSLGSNSRRKLLTAASIVSNYQQPRLWALDGLGDYDLTLRSTVQTDSALSTTGSPWDTSVWDTAAWDTPAGVTPAQPRSWRNLSASGYKIAVSLRLNSKAQNIVWYSTGLIFKNAGAI